MGKAKVFVVKAIIGKNRFPQDIANEIVSFAPRTWNRPPMTNERMKNRQAGLIVTGLPLLEELACERYELLIETLDRLLEAESFKGRSLIRWLPSWNQFQNDVIGLMNKNT